MKKDYVKINCNCGMQYIRITNYKLVTYSKNIPCYKCRQFSYGYEFFYNEFKKFLDINEWYPDESS